VEYKDEIVSILQSHIEFPNHQSGTSNLAAYCPFHKGGKESKPSFYVYVGPPTSNRLPGASFCHTCGEGWSLVGLLKKLAVPNSLIDTIRTHIEEAYPEQRRDKLEFGWTQLPEAILGLFSYLPKALLRAGFEKSILQQYEIGFDRSRKRIIFPIRNHLGELVAVSGRTVNDEWPRYKIYIDEFSEVVSGYSFDKKCVVWGLDKFYNTCMYNDTFVDMPVVVCEGFKAALWVIQSGYPYTVAILGTYLSKEQEALLSRVTNRVVLFLDNDEAGRKATNKIIENSLCGLEIVVANYRQELDKSPDDLSTTKVRAAIEMAQAPIVWRRSNE
jgi:5S rRNA maturation endonuclease (ribonuclease M5)